MIKLQHSSQSEVVQSSDSAAVGRQFLSDEPWIRTAYLEVPWSKL